jgi:hypothetical protein
MPILEARQQEAVNEAEELSHRIERLEAFETSPLYPQLDSHEQFRLSIQLGVMRVYLYILNERIEHFKTGS